ncbi:uncharacterized protein LOC128836452 [Malaclemys terrapin pileata]|uniref:uncharacterized protein LOC128836452 n=1 Tax=Malaclemys terrapin pileata TaxID=2991368 RepID=UPI0023A808FF|nr:uncharacterized protein LOC128836452 [Malaclemys terrapin pileata]
MSQAAADRMQMAACGSCGMYIVLAGDLEQRYVCMKCRLIVLLEEKIKGLQMQVDTLVEFRRGFEQLMEDRQGGAEGECSRVQEKAVVDDSERGMEGGEQGKWEHVTVRSRPRKRRASEGRIELRNRFGCLDNEVEGQQVVTEGGTLRKKRRAASPIERGEVMMETAKNLGPQRIEQGTRGSIREDRNRHRSGLEGSETRLLDRNVARQRQVYVIGDSLLRRLDRPVTRADPENRRVCCLPGAKIRDVDLRLKRILKGAERGLTQHWSEIQPLPCTNTT